MYTDMQNIDRFPAHPGKPVTEVDTGEVRVSRAPAVLHAPALGSCIAVLAYDRLTKIGGMAHVMLPGRAEKTSPAEKNRYAENAIDDLLDEVAGLGADIASLQVSLVGGADLIGDGNIHIQVRDSVMRYLEYLHITPAAQRLGGACARSVWMDLAEGNIYYTENGQGVIELFGCGAMEPRVDKGGKNE